MLKTNPSDNPIARNHRQAFTLIEVLLALTLSVLLLGAIFTSVSQTWRLTAIGREEMERSQLARALLRKMTLDIRSIAFVAPPPDDESTDSTSTSSSSSSGGSSGSSGSSSSGSSSGSSGSSGSGSSSGSGGSSGSSSSGSSSKSGSSSSSGSSSGSSGSSSSGSSSSSGANTTAPINSTMIAAAAEAAETTTTEVPSPTSIGIRGNAQMLEFHISRARRDLDFTANVDGNKLTTRTSDLRVITYQLSSGSGTQGLVRTDGDRMAALMMEEKGSTPLSLSMRQVLAPEVNYLQFRFFDGFAWYPTWDSVQAKRLPRAVEVTMGFIPAQSRNGPALRVGVSASANTVRSVIVIPIADPFPKELLQ